MPRRMTNTELVTNLMERSPHGAICQLFVLHAIERYAQQIAAVPLDELRDMFDISLISADAWRDVAVDTLARMREHYEGDK